jgi:acetoacetate decarboxylase
VIEVSRPYLAIMAEYFLEASSIDKVVFQHCQRDSNQVTHSLAKHDYVLKEILVWDGDPQVSYFLV